jgi:hypothetical protein
LAVGLSRRLAHAVRLKRYKCIQARMRRSAREQRVRQYLRRNVALADGGGRFGNTKLVKR